MYLTVRETSFVSSGGSHAFWRASSNHLVGMELAPSAHGTIEAHASKAVAIRSIFEIYTANDFEETIGGVRFGRDLAHNVRSNSGAVK